MNEHTIFCRDRKHVVPSFTGSGAPELGEVTVSGAGEIVKHSERIGRQLPMHGAIVRNPSLPKITGATGNINRVKVVEEAPQVFVAAIKFSKMARKLKTLCHDRTHRLLLGVVATLRAAEVEKQRINQYEKNHDAEGNLLFGHGFNRNFFSSEIQA